MRVRGLLPPRCVWSVWLPESAGQWLGAGRSGPAAGRPRRSSMRRRHRCRRPDPAIPPPPPARASRHRRWTRRLIPPRLRPRPPIRWPCRPERTRPVVAQSSTNTSTVKGQNTRPTPASRCSRRRPSTRSTAPWSVSPSRSSSTSSGRSPTGALAEQAIHISSNPPVPGAFYWTTDTQVRWRPYNFWPANTVVNIDASGAKSSFRVGDSLVATIDDNTHQMTVTRNGEVEKTFPVSMGMDNGKHETKNGTYYVLEKFPDLVMDSSTYGVPIELGVRLQDQGAVGGPHRQQRRLRARRAVVGRQIRASATSATAASTSARPTPSGSTTTSAVVTRSW